MKNFQKVAPQISKHSQLPSAFKRLSFIFSYLAIPAAIGIYNFSVEAQVSPVKELPSAYKLKEGFSIQTSKEDFLKSLPGFQNLTVDMAKYLEDENLFFFEIDYVKGGSKKIGGPEKEHGVSMFHEILPSEKALGVRAVLLRRDYEADSHESGFEDSDLYEHKAARALAKKEHDKLKEFAFDTLHVLALPESRTPPALATKLEKMIQAKNGVQLFLSDNLNSDVAERLEVLKAFKNATWLQNHKVLKGPFWNEKTAFVQNPEEEWGAGSKAPREAVLYRDPVTFLDLQTLGDSENVYLLFYADDSGDWRFMKSADPDGDRDDIVGVFKINTKDFQGEVGTKKALALRNIKEDLDIALVLESSNSLKAGEFVFYATQNQEKSPRGFIDLATERLLWPQDKLDVAPLCQELLAYPTKAFRHVHIMRVAERLESETRPEVQLLLLKLLLEKGGVSPHIPPSYAYYFLKSKFGPKATEEKLGKNATAEELKVLRQIEEVASKIEERYK